MDRRGFLTGLIGAVAASALDPDRLLWTPTKTIFIPPGSVIPALRQHLYNDSIPVDVLVDVIDITKFGDPFRAYISLSTCLWRTSYGKVLKQNPKGHLNLTAYNLLNQK